MAIREQGYRHWEGTYTGHAWRWWTITSAGVRAVVSTKVRLALVIGLIFLSWIWPIVMVFLYTLAPFAVVSRGDLYEYYRSWQVFYGVLMAAVVGSGLVASDLGSNALHIYLSRPLRRVDYIVGKAGVVVLWLATVTLAPMLFMFTAGLLATSDAKPAPEGAWEILGEILVLEALTLTVLASLILAFSAVSRKWTFALIAWIAFYFLSGVVSGIAAGVSGEANWRLLGLSANLGNVAQALFEQTATAPEWLASLLVLGGLVLAAVGVFVGRILTLEVAE